MALSVTKATKAEYEALKAADSTNPNFILRGEPSYLIQVPKSYRKSVTFDSLNGLLYIEEKTW